jgi:hypothetical protein
MFTCFGGRGRGRGGEGRGGEGRGRRFREIESDLSRIDFLMRLDDFQHTSDDLASVQVLVGAM